MRPFLKWAGSKKWLVRRGLQVPTGKFDRYFEPFVGSGAVFFDLLPRNAVLSDMNSHLMNCYEQLRGDWRSVFEVYKKLFSAHSKLNYYKIRENLVDEGTVGAGQFLYLNRTCFNGIFRVNLAGKFNVPLGSKISDPFDETDFEGWARALATSELHNCDFKTVIDRMGHRDFAFVDPPYTVAHNKNGFIEYNEHIFSWDDQLRLASALIRAKNRGASFIVTNANHQSVRQLYEPYFHVEDIDRQSAIAANVAKRRSISEIIIQTDWTMNSPEFSSRLRC